MKKMPDNAIVGAWEEMKGIQLNPSTAVPGKYKELIGLAVSAQVPCEYCVYAHTQFAKLNGATDAEIAEAVVMGSLTRHWSTFINGLQPDEAKFRGEIAKMIDHMKKGGQPKAIDVVDGKTALADIEQRWGVAPEFVRQFPQEGLAGAWKEQRDVEMAENTAIPPKYKSLISLGVAAQIPCRYCVVADTEFAKLSGVSDRERYEAVAVASIVRHWSTWLNGMQLDKATFKKDIDRVVKEVKKNMSKTAQK